MSVTLVMSYATLKFLLVIIITLFVPLWILLKKNVYRSFQLARKLPGPSLWKIVAVHARRLLSDEFLNHILELTSRYDYKPWKIWTLVDQFIVISDPETIGAAFKSKNLLNKDSRFYAGVREFIGDSSLVLNGPAWKVRRSLVNPAFNKAYLETNLDVIYEEAVRLIEKLRKKADGTDIDFKHFTETTLMRSSVRSLGDRDLNLDDKLIEDFSWAISFGTLMSQQKFVNPIYGYLAAKFVRKYRELLKKFFRIREVIIWCVVRKSMMSFLKGEKTPNTPLAFLVVGASKNNVLTEHEVLCELTTLLAASVETTSTVLASVVCLLALNPHVQSQVVNEVESIFGHSNRPIVPEDLSRLKYLEKVIKESMRLFPPGSILIRRVADESDLSGTIVPKGASVIFNILGLHRNPRVFKDPLKFDPERFASGAQEMRHPYSYLPFSSGARNCVGRLQAMMVLKTVLSTLLRNYKILPGQGLKDINDMEIKLYFTMRLCNTSVRMIPVNNQHCEN